MRRHLLGVFTIACGLLAGTATAQAAAETWVSRNGANTGNCQITAPCRTFAYAHSQTSNHGAINVLSSGNFGPLTITKPISIVAQGVEAVINTDANGAAIRVQAGGAARVSLRGLTIDMRGGANHGISFVSGAALHVHNCVIRRADNGIEYTPATGTSELYVADSVIANSSDTGINVRPTGSANAKIVLDRVRLENAAFNGLVVAAHETTGSINATLRDSVVDGGFGTGINVVDVGAGTTAVMIDRSAIVNNFHGLSAGGAGATIRIGDSTVAGNSGSGFLAGTGTIASYGTNKVNGNGTDGAPTSTIPMK